MAWSQCTMNDQWLPDLLNLWIIVYVKRSNEIPEAPPRWGETHSRNSSCQKELRKTICWRESLATILFANHNGERSFSGQTAPSVVLRLNHPFNLERNHLSTSKSISLIGRNILYERWNTTAKIKECDCLFGYISRPRLLCEPKSMRILTCF